MLTHTLWTAAFILAFTSTAHAKSGDQPPAAAQGAYLGNGLHWPYGSDMSASISVTVK